MGGFDSLSSLGVLGEDISRKGNEAEAANSPDTCFSALRAFVDYTLDFLEKEHSIPELTAEELSGPGSEVYRIDRLSKRGPNLSRSEIRALQKLREFGNKGSHPAKNKAFFTAQNVELALNYARIVRDSLCARYAQGAPEKVGPAKCNLRLVESARQNRVPATVVERFWFHGVDLPQQPTIAQSQALPHETNQKAATEREGSTAAGLIRAPLVGIGLFVCVTAYLLLNKAAPRKSDLGEQTNSIARPEIEWEKVTGSTQGSVEILYRNPCGRGKISSGASCFPIPSGPVDFSLSAGDILDLPLGQAGYLTAITGGLFVQEFPSGSLSYLMPGKRIFVTSSTTMKVEKDGTLAEFRPEQ